MITVLIIYNAIFALLWFCLFNKFAVSTPAFGQNRPSPVLVRAVTQGMDSSLVQLQTPEVPSCRPVRLTHWSGGLFFFFTDEADHLCLSRKHKG